LTTGDLAKPFPKLRQELLAALQTAEGRIREEIEQAAAVGPLICNAVQESLRIIGSALLLALPFASGAQPRRSMTTLLVDFLAIRKLFRFDASGITKGLASPLETFQRRTDQRRSPRHHEKLRRAHEARLRRESKRAARRTSR
jgi:hypothetical protein